MRRRPYDLRNLMRGGASPRVLDLCGVHARFPDLERCAHPLFRHGRLNRAFLIKHNLRRHERRLVISGRSIVTKLVLPIDTGDPGAGALWTFVESPDLEGWLESALGRDRKLHDDEFDADVKTLAQLRHAPSFDPFLLQTVFEGRKVDPRYFTMNTADEREYQAFVYTHMAQISRMALGGADAGRRSGRLASVLFDDEKGGAREDLRVSLHMEDADFEAGVFGWKGLLYYLWRMDVQAGALTGFLRQMRDLEAVDAGSRDQALGATIPQLRAGVARRWRSLLAARDLYYRVVSAFLNKGDPAAMRDLLLRAPRLFGQLGDDTGSLTHLTSYWNYWCEQSETGIVSYAFARNLLPELAGDVSSEGADGALEAA